MITKVHAGNSNLEHELLLIVASQALHDLIWDWRLGRGKVSHADFRQLQSRGDKGNTRMACGIGIMTYCSPEGTSIIGSRRSGTGYFDVTMQEMSIEDTGQLRTVRRSRPLLNQAPDHFTYSGSTPYTQQVSKRCSVFCL